MRWLLTPAPVAIFPPDLVEIKLASDGPVNSKESMPVLAGVDCSTPECALAVGLPVCVRIDFASLCFVVLSRGAFPLGAFCLVFGPKPFPFGTSRLFFSL